MIMVDGQPVKCQIWDTAGQEKYHSLAPMYYRGAAAAVLVFDISKRASFRELQCPTTVSIKNSVGVREWVRLVSSEDDGECSGEPRYLCSSVLEISIVQIGLETTE